jgi:hypothetical protein
VVPSHITATVNAVRAASSWDTRVAAIRQVPERHGVADHQDVYAAIADALYKQHLSPMFAHVPWRDYYELEPFRLAYAEAYQATEGFTRVSVPGLRDALRDHPRALRIFRVLFGYSPSEFADTVTVHLAEKGSIKRVGAGRVSGTEGGRKPNSELAQTYAETINRLMNGTMWPEPEDPLHSKLDKPDTAEGWASVQTLAASGVPLDIYLHQRFYGGAFRQLLDGTSNLRGGLLELPVEELFQEHGVPHIRTGSHNQAEIEERFGLTVKPAPDFIVFDQQHTLRAMLECKQANDGGTARDKAGRFRSLRQESIRLGGVPLFAMLDGLGWRRTNDALGPVVRDADGRVFTLATVGEMLKTQPFPQLLGLVEVGDPPKDP